MKIYKDIKSIAKLTASSNESITSLLVTMCQMTIATTIKVIDICMVLQMSTDGPGNGAGE
jgi:hypothetical protein